MSEPRWLEGDDIALGLDADEEEYEDDPDIWHDQQFED
jgi:hypothetical protein